MESLFNFVSVLFENTKIVLQMFECSFKLEFSLASNFKIFEKKS